MSTPPTIDFKSLSPQQLASQLAQLQAAIQALTQAPNQQSASIPTGLPEGDQIVGLPETNSELPPSTETTSVVRDEKSSASSSSSNGIGSLVETSTNSSSGQVDTQTGTQASDSTNNVPGNPLPGAVVESQAEVVAEEKTGDTEAPASTENGANDETKGEASSAKIPSDLVPEPNNNNPVVRLPVPVVVTGLVLRRVQDPIDLVGEELPAPASPSTGDPQVLVPKPADPKVSTGK